MAEAGRVDASHYCKKVYSPLSALCVIDRCQKNLRIAAGNRESLSSTRRTPIVIAVGHWSRRPPCPDFPDRRNRKIRSHEIQILDSWGVEELKHGDCGGIYERWANGQGYEGHPPRQNASRPAGKWQSFDVVFRAPRFDAGGKKIANARFVKVVHNGKVIHENVEVTGPTRAAIFGDEKPTGPLMLQGDHGPVAYRNIRIANRQNVERTDETEHGMICDGIVVIPRGAELPDAWSL